VGLETFPGKTPPTGRPAQSPADQALARADQAARSQKYAEAAGLFEAFLDAYPADPRREYALSGAARANELSERYAPAIRDYGALLNEFPKGGYAAEARARLPQLHLYSGDFQEAVNSSLDLSKGERNRTLRANLILVEAKGRYLLGENLAAAKLFLEAAGALEGAAREDAVNGLYASFSKLNQLDLNEFAKKGGSSFPGPEAVWFMAYLSHARGDQEAFLAQAQYFKTYFPDHPWGSSLDALAAGGRGVSVPGAAFDPRAKVQGPVLQPPPLAGGQGIGPLARSFTVAALLPLSGARNSAYALEILAGLRLAAQRSQNTLNVVEYDTRGVPAEAVRLTHDIAMDPNVVAIVGPLNSDESLAAAQTAHQLSMPLIAVSTRIGLPTSRPTVFRVFLTYELQAVAAARWAVNDRGHKEIGALYPDDLYGSNMLKYFESEATRLGARITARESYKSPGGDYAAAAARLAGGAGAVRNASASYQAETSFSTLYIPESPSAVSQILPFLAYNDITRMELLGTSLWASPEFVKSSGRYLAGSVIPVAFSPLSKRPEAEGFLEAYRALAGQDPSQFAVYGHDAGLALIAALSTGAEGRGALVEALKALPPVPGASGPFTFDSEGEYQVSPVLLTVDGTEFKLLKDALAY
jgi:ABC-type branched-subunit amino acid transport system substrate-binding protein